jgi:hypothetical protein
MVVIGYQKPLKSVEEMSENRSSEKSSDVLNKGGLSLFSRASSGLV